MPELPEVETVRRGLLPVMEGAVIEKLVQNRPDLRFPLPENFSRRITGRTVTALARRAKYLLAYLDDGNVLVCHLGMSGSFRIETRDQQDAQGGNADGHTKNQSHDHVVFILKSSNGFRTAVTYNDPRRFGFMLLISEDEFASHRMFANLGVEPTGNSLSGDVIRDLFRGKRAPLKAALLDQRLIAGLGNIYVCEALWRANLDPRRQAGSISGAGKRQIEACENLANAIRAVISEAINSGGSSLRDHVQTDGSLGYFQHSFAVYDREGQDCSKPGCKGTIERLVQSGRSTFFCRKCQR